MQDARIHFGLSLWVTAPRLMFISQLGQTLHTHRRLHWQEFKNGKQQTSIHLDVRFSFIFEIRHQNLIHEESVAFLCLIWKTTWEHTFLILKNVNVWRPRLWNFSSQIFPVEMSVSIATVFVDNPTLANTWGCKGAGNHCAEITYCCPRQTYSSQKASGLLWWIWFVWLVNKSDPKTYKQAMKLEI